MPEKDPLRKFTRGIPEAVEHNDAFRAMFTDDRVIPHSFGSIASALVENDAVEPTVEAVCAFLHVEVQDLRNPTIVISDSWSLEGFQETLCRDWANEYKAAHADDEHPYLDYLRQAINGWEHEEGEDKAEELYAKCDELREQERAIRAKFPGDGREAFDARRAATKQIRAEQDLLFMRARAYDSGLLVDCAVLFETLMGFEGKSSFSFEELMQVFQGAYKVAVRNLLSNEDVIAASDVVFDRDIIEDVISKLDRRLASRPRLYAEAKWAEIEHVFVAPRPEDHFLFAGNEK